MKWLSQRGGMKGLIFLYHGQWIHQGIYKELKQIYVDMKGEWTRLAQSYSLNKTTGKNCKLDYLFACQMGIKRPPHRNIQKSKNGYSQRSSYDERQGGDTPIQAKR